MERRTPSEIVFVRQDNGQKRRMQGIGDNGGLAGEMRSKGGSGYTEWARGRDSARVMRRFTIACGAILLFLLLFAGSRADEAAALTDTPAPTATPTPARIKLDTPGNISCFYKEVCFDTVPHAAGYEIREEGGISADSIVRQINLTSFGPQPGKRACVYHRRVIDGFLKSVIALADPEDDRYEDSDASKRLDFDPSCALAESCLHGYETFTYTVPHTGIYRHAAEEGCFRFHQEMCRKNITEETARKRADEYITKHLASNPATGCGVFVHPQLVSACAISVASPSDYTTFKWLRDAINQHNDLDLYMPERAYWRPPEYKACPPRLPQPENLTAIYDPVREKIVLRWHALEGEELAWLNDGAVREYRAYVYTENDGWVEWLRANMEDNQVDWEEPDKIVLQVESDDLPADDGAKFKVYAVSANINHFLNSRFSEVAYLNTATPAPTTTPCPGQAETESATDCPAATITPSPGPQLQRPQGLTLNGSRLCWLPVQFANGYRAEKDGNPVHPGSAGFTPGAGGRVCHDFGEVAIGQHLRVRALDTTGAFRSSLPAHYFVSNTHTPSPTLTLTLTPSITPAPPHHPHPASAPAAAARPQIRRRRYPLLVARPTHHHL